MKNNFESFLQDKFMEIYHGDKDAYENAFEAWLENLDVQELIYFADEALKAK